MNVLPEYTVEELFEIIENKLSEVKKLWESGEEFRRELLSFNLMVFELSDALSLDIANEVLRADELAESIMEVIGTDIEAGM